MSLFGTIFVRHLQDDVAARLGPAAADQITSGGGQVDPTKLAAMPAPLKEALFQGIASSLSTVFVWAIPFAAVVAVLALFIKEIPLRGDDDDAAGGDTADASRGRAPVAWIQRSNAPPAPRLERLRLRD